MYRDLEPSVQFLKEHTVDHPTLRFSDSEDDVLPSGPFDLRTKFTPQLQKGIWLTDVGMFGESLVSESSPFGQSFFEREDVSRQILAARAGRPWTQSPLTPLESSPVTLGSQNRKSRRHSNDAWATMGGTKITDTSLAAEAYTSAWASETEEALQAALDLPAALGTEKRRLELLACVHSQSLLRLHESCARCHAVLDEVLAHYPSLDDLNVDPAVAAASASLQVR